MGSDRNPNVAMAKLPNRATLVPLAFSLAILAAVLAAALGPATGMVAASSSCQYGTCTSNGPGLLTYGVGAIVALIILLIAAAVIYQRRRGGGGSPPAAGGGAVAAWSGTTGPESPAAGEAAPYMEGPEDVAAGAAVGAGAGAAAADASEAQPADIDSLMGELDKISGEILKRGPGKKGPPSGGAGDAAPADT
jgi:hypothetical protein